jgi:nucleoside 2-deoxyribosyltransferase
MNIYLAAPYVRRKMAREYGDRLRARGAVITHDWTHDPTSALPETQLPRHEQIAIVKPCLSGIEQAQIFWLLAFPHEGIGSYVELGYALLQRKVEPSLRIIVSGVPRTAFTILANARVDEHDDALRLILDDWMVPTQRS